LFGVRSVFGMTVWAVVRVGTLDRGAFGVLAGAWRRAGVRSGGGGLLAGVLAGQSEHGESGEVDGCGEELEVGYDFGFAAHAGAAAAVSAAREVSGFALDRGAGGVVVGGPLGVLLAVPGACELLLVRPSFELVH
jgi:hypothetical protein